MRQADRRITGHGQQSLRCSARSLCFCHLSHFRFQVHGISEKEMRRMWQSTEFWKLDKAKTKQVQNLNQKQDSM
eukprot:s2567_g4.t1